MSDEAEYDMRPTADEWSIYRQINHADDDWTEGAREALRRLLERAWDNGVDTATQYAEQPWVVDDECKPLNPYRTA